MSGQALTNLLSALLVGRVPKWTQVDIVNRLDFPPDAQSAGEVLGGSPRTRLFASTKRLQDRRTGFVFIKTQDTTATWTIGINSTDSVFDAAAAFASSEADVYDGIFDAIEGNQPHAPAISITKLTDSDGRTNGIRVESDPSGTYPADGIPTIVSFTNNVVTGAGVLGIYGEADDFDLQLWVTSVRGQSDGPPDAAQWVQIYAATGTNAISSAGRFGVDGISGIAFGDTFDGLLDTAGAERLAAVISDFNMPVLVPADHASVEPAFYVHIGPSSDEGLDAEES